MSAEHDTDTGLSHQVTCETQGTDANGYSGKLIPIEYVSGLSRAELVELLIPGDDEEETEVFRQRVLDSFQSQAFGGNQAAYGEKVQAMPGVGDAKIHPVWNSDIHPATLAPNESVKAWFEASVLLTVRPSNMRVLMTAYLQSFGKIVAGGFMEYQVAVEIYPMEQEE